MSAPPNADNATARRYDRPGSECPVCDSHTKGCSLTADAMQRCRGTPADPAAWHGLRRSAEWAFYRPAPTTTPPKQAGRDARAAVDWAAQVERHHATFRRYPQHAGRFAALYDLPETACNHLRIGSGNDRGGAYFFAPETDARGTVIGAVRRYVDGERLKMAVRGSRRGLTLPTGWRERPGPLFVVEGMSDALAMTEAGLCCVARFSALGGVRFLAELLKDWPADRPIVIVGENDLKPNGDWPGRDGAESVARQLAAMLGRVVYWVMTPGGLKDSRAWLTAPERAETPWAGRGAQLAALLTADPCEVAPEPEAEARDEGGRCANDGPDDPHRLGALFLDDYRTDAGVLTLRHWRGEFFRWACGAYRPLADGTVQALLTARIRAEFVRLNLEAQADRPREDRGDDDDRTPRTAKVTRALVANVENAVRSLCAVPAEIEAPAWLDGHRGPDPDGLVLVANGAVDLAAFAAGRIDCLLMPDPRMFALNASPVAFDLWAPKPERGFRFMEECHPGDREAVALIQEWTGLQLVDDTSHQKILLNTGGGRNGKGTYARLLRPLVGEASVAALDLSALSKTFGLQPLLNKTVAIAGDFRLSGRADAGALVERLNSISGEDLLSVDRKNLSALSVKLAVRLTVLSNEVPRLPDHSQAVTRRFLVVRWGVSFRGKEDAGLDAALRAELPSLLLWALGGLVRLRERGRFVQPQSAADTVRMLGELASPIAMFVAEQCAVGDGLSVVVSDLFDAWSRWCAENGRRRVGSRPSFGAALRAAVPGVACQQPNQGGERRRVYVGISLAAYPASADASVPPACGLACRTPDVFTWPVGPAASAISAIYNEHRGGTKDNNPPTAGGEIGTLPERCRNAGVNDENPMNHGADTLERFTPNSVSYEENQEEEEGGNGVLDAYRGLSGTSSVPAFQGDDFATPDAHQQPAEAPEFLEFTHDDRGAA